MKPRVGCTRHALESCTLQLHSWSPFKSPPDGSPLKKPCKRPCHSDRSTADLALLDLSSLSLADDLSRPRKVPFLARKRRRHPGGSRSVSGRSSEQSATRRRRCCSVGGSHATCSDYPPVVAGGTDSSGEMFLNGDGSWGSEVGEVRAIRREVFGTEREGPPGACGFAGPVEQVLQGNEFGYGSETGYKGDAEFGYEDEVEVDEEEEDAGKHHHPHQHLFWRERFGDENNFSEVKSHPRCRRKKAECKTTSEKD